MIEENKISNFVVSIKEEAEQQKAKIEEETKKYIAYELEKVENSALHESYDYIKHEVAKIREESGRNLSLQLSEQSKVLNFRRNEICDIIFSAVTEKLYSFTTSNEYKEFLQKSAALCAKAFSGKNLIVFLRPADQVFTDIIEQAIGKCEFKQDSTILLGGIKMSDESGAILADDTLDSRLELKREWFIRNSGLIISKQSH